MIYWFKSRFNCL